jgi:DNA-binding GntR family transcriptional regulator
MTAAYALRPVGRDSLRDQAYAAIRDGVRAGRFAPGERVTIRALAAALGTSPTPVREALGQLVAEGTFELLANGSASIPAMTLERFAQLQAMREALEGLAAERAAAAIGAAALADVRGLLAELQALAAAGDFKRYLARHRAFHFAVYRAAGMPLLTEAIDALWLRCGPVLSFVVPDYVRRKQGAAHHAALVAALAAGDGAAARAAVCGDIADAAAWLCGLADAEGVIRDRPAAARRA